MMKCYMPITDEQKEAFLNAAEEKGIAVVEKEDYLYYFEDDDDLLYDVIGNKFWYEFD